MITYQRHSKRNCPHAADKGRARKRCGCPIWCEGYLPDGQFVRRSLKTSDWAEAEKEIDRLKTPATVPAEPRAAAAITIEAATQAWLGSIQAKSVSAGTFGHYDLIARRLVQFSHSRGLAYLPELTVERMADFQATWTGEASTKKEIFKMVRRFLKFCVGRKFLADDPAVGLIKPKVLDKEPVPYERAEIARFLAAVDLWPGEPLTRVRLRALVLLLRFSGLRIGDAAMLRRDRIQDGTLMLRTEKSGTVVRLPLPSSVLTALDAIPGGSAYFFWSGESAKTTVTHTWWKALHKLAGLAKVPNSHPHRFRHTFAVECLQAGVPLEEVAVLLGHSSVIITEKFYAPWVKQRQQRLETLVRQTWNADLLATTPPVPALPGNSATADASVHGAYTAPALKPN